VWLVELQENLLHKNDSAPEARLYEYALILYVQTQRVTIESLRNFARYCDLFLLKLTRDGSTWIDPMWSLFLYG